MEKYDPFKPGWTSGDSRAPDALQFIKRAVIVASGNLVEDITYYRLYPEKLRTYQRTDEELDDRSKYNSLSRARTQFRRIFSANTERHFNKEANKFHKPIFITLTYSNDYLPDNEKRARYDLQQFVRRFARAYNFKPKYLAVPELGELHGRMHWHFAIFNLPTNTTIKNDLLSFWPYGFSKLGFKPRRSREKRLHDPEICMRYMIGYMSKDLKFRYHASRNLLRPVRIPDTERPFPDVSDELQRHTPE